MKAPEEGLLCSKDLYRGRRVFGQIGETARVGDEAGSNLQWVGQGWGRREAGACGTRGKPHTCTNTGWSYSTIGYRYLSHPHTTHTPYLQYPSHPHHPHTTNTHLTTRTDTCMSTHSPPTPAPQSALSGWVPHSSSCCQGNQTAVCGTLPVPLPLH